MYRLLLLGATALCALTAQGQNLRIFRRYQVYEEEVSFFNVKTFHFQRAPIHKVDYILTADAEPDGAVQLNRHSLSDPSSPMATGSLLCRMSGLKSLGYRFVSGVLTETYNASYKVFKGGMVPPAAAIPDLHPVQMNWEEHCDGSCTLRVSWFVQPKPGAAQPQKGSSKSYYEYTMYCRPLE